MKKIKTTLLLVFGITFLTFSQQNNYQKIWEEVEEEVEKGLYKSAIETLELINQKAIKDDKHDQAVKSFLFILRYQNYIEEDHLIKSIKRLDSVIKISEEPQKAIYQSIQGEVYWNFHEKNQWKRKEYAQIQDDGSYNILTQLDLKSILLRAQKYYDASLNNASLIKKYKTQDLIEVIAFNKNNILRPSLYDLLIQRQIDFLYYSDLKEYFPDKELPENNYLFVDINQFVQQNFGTKPLAKVFQKFQFWVRFHQKDKDQTALNNINLIRLELAEKINQNSNYYLQSLYDFAKTQKDTLAGNVYFKIASYYNNLKKSDSIKDAKIKAHDLFEKLISKYPNTLLANNSNVQLDKIKSKSIKIEINNVNSYNQKTKSNIKYKNIDSLFCWVIKRSSNDAIYDKKLNISTLNQEAKNITFWTQKLINPKDYLPHSTEIVLPDLELGFYELIISSSSSLNIDSTHLSRTSFWISNLALSSNRGNDNFNLAVYDRSEGSPLKKVAITTFKKEYNYRSSGYKISKLGTTYSNENGEATVTQRKGNHFFYLQNEDDEFVTNSLYGNKRRELPDKESIRLKFFTDRSIYRPGQKLYFKALAFSKKGKERKIVPDKDFKISLKDANWQTVAELELTSNMYGSINGEFTLPESMVGNFRLQSSYGNEYFKVEEYKRPKFDIKLEKPKEQTSFNKPIILNGVAKSFSGSPIDNASAHIEIYKTNISPWWRSNNTPDEKIKTLDTLTNSNGEVAINFTPLRENKRKSVFNYKVILKVTDINGETHETSTLITVSDFGFKLSSSEGKLEIDQLDSITINAFNYSNQPQQVEGKATIYKLIPPKQQLHKSYWERPDLPLLSKSEFETAFPNEVYKNENNSKLWDSVFIQEVSFYTNKQGRIKPFNSLNLEPGEYRIVSTAKDQSNNTIRSSKNLHVFNKKSKKNTLYKPFWVNLKSTTVEVGEQAEIVIGSNFEDFRVNYKVYVGNKLIKTQWLMLDKSQLTLTIPIVEEYKGGIAIQFYGVKNERDYYISKNIIVPYSDKELNVELISYRNKLETGSKEKWQLKILGPKGEKVSSEILASMYDASLDKIYQKNWSFYPWPENYTVKSTKNFGFGSHSGYHSSNIKSKYYVKTINIPFIINPTDFKLGYRQSLFNSSLNNQSYRYDEIAFLDEIEEEAVATESRSKGNIKRKFRSLNAPSFEDMDSEVSENYSIDKDGGAKNEIIEDKKGNDPIKIRANFNETAFFYPSLKTDSDGNTIFEFTVPDALTEWKFRAFATSKEFQIGWLEKLVKTQKKLMVFTNTPRFIRTGDEYIFTTKITNLSEKNSKGKATLELYDAFTDETLFQLEPKNFNINQKSSTSVSWSIKIPQNLEGLKYKLVARGQQNGDGEENIIPVLSNRMLVTETLPFTVRKEGEQSIIFNKLKNNQSNTLQSRGLTIEYTNNPVWYAVLALPYMAEYPHDCSEQIFNRFYANSIAQHIVSSNPKIDALFKKWENESEETLLSNLSQNQELKNVLINETPWVLESKSETEQRKKIAQLFKAYKLKNEIDKSINKLRKNQLASGAFSWFKGMYPSRYITQYITNGFAHLQNLEINTINYQTRNILKKSLQFLDRELIKDFEQIKKYDTKFEQNQHVSYQHILYLYSRYQFKDILEINSALKPAYEYFEKQALTYWKSFNNYGKGLIALGLYKNQKVNEAKMIIASLKETAIVSDKLGMYWKGMMNGSYNWYQAPIETQALLIEAFSTITEDIESIENLKFWLLRQKQTQNWKTTKATADAVYALLLQGTNWTENNNTSELKIGNFEFVENTPTSSNHIQVKPIPGLGYIKYQFTKDIDVGLSEIKVKKSGNTASWGALYWQYYENIDKITSSENYTGISLKKELYKVVAGDNGEKLIKIENDNVSLGDKIRVRIIVNSDRKYEYVHLKDQRAASFEPLKSLSGYQWSKNLGYYLAIKDASMNFFMDILPKGTFIFEYDIFATQEGDFSNGISQIQCMYAPEFSFISGGRRINVQK